MRFADEPNVHENAAQPHHRAYVGASFGDLQLRLDCDEFSPVDENEAQSFWKDFFHRGVIHP